MKKPIPIVIVALILLASVSCQQEAAPGGFTVADLFATPGKALATIELSPTPQPSPSPGGPTPQVTAPPTQPLPTVVILPQPTQPLSTIPPTRPTSTPRPDPTQTPTAEGVVDCDIQPDDPFAAVYQADAELAAVLGCPADDVDLYTVVYQPFETGMMFWRQADQRIWALTTAQLDQGFDAWWRFQDEYDGGDQPVEDPPEGLLQPIRGFGEVWNTNGFIREALGWATGPEQQATVPWQDFDDGWMMAAPDGTIFVMIPDEEDPTTGRHSGPLP